MWENIKKYCPIFFIYALGVFVILNLVIYFSGLLIYLDVLTFFDKTYSFFAAFSGLASVFVAIVAMIISLKTSRQQKELQLRQIKLDSYNLRYKCWYAFSRMEFFFEVAKDMFGCEYCNIDVEKNPEYSSLIKNIRELLDFSSALNEVKFMVSAEDYDVVKEIRKILLKTYRLHTKEIDVETEQIDFIQLLDEVIPKVEVIRKKLEQDLFIVDIHKC